MTILMMVGNSKIDITKDVYEKIIFEELQKVLTEYASEVSDTLKKEKIKSYKEGFEHGKKESQAKIEELEFEIKDAQTGVNIFQTMSNSYYKSAMTLKEENSSLKSQVKELTQSELDKCSIKSFAEGYSQGRESILVDLRKIIEEN